jgi:hypothetical protein
MKVRIPEIELGYQDAPLLAARVIATGSAD